MQKKVKNLLFVIFNIVREVLIKDATLFRELEFMDYSLLIKKINLDLYKKENGTIVQHV